MKTIELRQFNGGIKNDPRDPSANAARYLTNFDALTNPYKLTPYRDTESGDTAAATSQKQNFCIALRTGVTYRLYSLGVVSGAGLAEVLMKDITITANDLSDSGWLTPANNQAASGTTSFNLFTFYAKTGLIYGASGGSTIWTFDPSSVAVFSSASHSLSYTNIAEGLVHSKDDILYVPYDNKIAKNDNGSWTDTALTLPTSMYITSICEKGNYLAIFMAPLSGIGGSRCYLWDRDTSLTTLSESIDWGEGIVKVGQELNGTLIGISLVGGNTTRITDRVVFKYYTGSGAETFYTLQGTSTASNFTQLLSAKQRIDNRLFFMMQIKLNGTIRSGVWSVGHLGNNQFTVIHEMTPSNNTAFAITDNMKGFIKVGDYTFQSYQLNGVYGLSKTNDTASYTATSYYETTINPGMSPGDKVQRKLLNAVGAMYESFPAGGSCTVSYKVNSAAAWTAIFTETTTGVVFTEPVQNDAAGSKFTLGREYEFQIKCTGGVEITGLIYLYSILQSNALPK